MATLSEALKEAYASAPTAKTILHTLEFRHDSFLDELGNPTAVRVVLDHEDLTATLEDDAPMNAGEAVLFQKGHFDFALPEQSDNSALPEIVISVDNATRLLMPYLDAAIEGGGSIEVTYRAYLSDDLTGPETDPPLTLTINQIDVNLSTVEARATFGDFANRRFPGVDYDAASWPGLAAL